MGLSGISPLSLLLILGIMIVIFGTKRLRNIGHDLGAAVKSFRDGMNEINHVNKPTSKKEDAAEE